MPATAGSFVTGAVEGLLDAAVFQRVVRHVGAASGPVHGMQGKSHLLQRLNGYNQAAAFAPWLVIIDLDNDADCAPSYQQTVLPNPTTRMCFRIAVREVEAWLLADTERIAARLSVAESRVPSAPQQLARPKRSMVDLARRSRRKIIREGMVPRQGSGRQVGATYTSELIGFVSDGRAGWRPGVAANRCDSLARCITCLKQLIAKSGPD